MNPELGSLLYLLLVIPLSVVSDALRDRWRSIDANVLDWPYQNWSRPWRWWRWHLIKWLNLYAPHVFIIHLLWPNLRWYEVTLVAALMYFVWRRIYNYGEKK